MPHDPARVADTKAWLARAADDLQAAEQLLSGSSALPSVAVFHCQQAAEKAMKGFLAWHDVPFRKTHNLEEIGEACLAIDPALEEIVDRAVPLT
jgi:HEPN domain-containing protein